MKLSLNRFYNYFDYSVVFQHCMTLGNVYLVLNAHQKHSTELQPHLVFIDVVLLAFCLSPGKPMIGVAIRIDDMYITALIVPESPFIKFGTVFSHAVVVPVIVRREHLVVGLSVGSSCVGVEGVAAEPPELDSVVRRLRFDHEVLKLGPVPGAVVLTEIEVDLVFFGEGQIVQNVQTEPVGPEPRHALAETDLEFGP